VVVRRWSWSAGRPGVGKSRLVRQFAGRSRGAGARVLIGGCLELGADSLPFAPLISVLRGLGRKIGLVAVNPVFIPYLADQIARRGLHQRVIAVQAVQPEPGQFNRAFDDEREYRSVREAFTGAAEPMLGLGIDVIIPAGGYPMLLFTREPSFAVGGATVLNGLPVAVAAAETAIRLSRLNGTGTSRRTVYGLPPGEAVTEFRRAFTTARSE
jgi:hypothetical protein